LAAVHLAAGEKLRVVADTTLIGDVVTQIGGDAIQLTVLLDPGADPHSYQATPEDLRAIDDAHLIFVNGLGLEESLGPILGDARAKTVSVNMGVKTIAAAASEDVDHRGGVNPHTWWSLAAVEQWTRNIADSLTAVDPDRGAQYTANAAAYWAQLQNLGVELDGLVARVPPAQRKLATDHDTLAYFARDFGFQIIGLVVPSFSTQAEPSAQHLAALQNQIRDADVQVILVGSTVNPRLAERLAQDMGIRVIPIFTDSLSAAGGPAPSYVEFMRYNVTVIVNALLGK